MIIYILNILIKKLRNNNLYNNFIKIIKQKNLLQTKNNL